MGLIDRARKRAQQTVKNLPPIKKLSDALGVKPRPQPKLTPAQKRKKIKPKK